MKILFTFLTEKKNLFLTNKKFVNLIFIIKLLWYHPKVTYKNITWKILYKRTWTSFWSLILLLRTRILVLGSVSNFIFVKLINSIVGRSFLTSLWRIFQMFRLKTPTMIRKLWYQILAWNNWYQKHNLLDRTLSMKDAWKKCVTFEFSHI